MKRIQKKLYELRLTWEGIFSRTRLYNLDKKLHQLDPTWPIITPDKKSSPNTNTRENKRRFYRAMKIGSYIKRNNEGMYTMDTFELNKECNNAEMNTSLTMGKNKKNIC